jgi:hypothetical protein
MGNIHMFGELHPDNHKVTIKKYEHKNNVQNKYNW